MESTTLNTPERTQSVKQLSKLASQLAESHHVTTKSNQQLLLLDHLDAWRRMLKDAYLRFRSASPQDLAFTYAGEWMLDNFYIIEQTIRQIREDLPPGYYRQLPVLESTALTGYPQIFAVAWELIQYTRSQLDADQVEAFVQGYQEVRLLTMGELWALPTMLRLGILQSLVETVAHITGIDQSAGPQALPILPFTRKIASELIVANCFVSLKMLATLDWKTFFEETSRVEQILRQDPMGIYPDMDFETRNTYREVVEELARGTGQSEAFVAQEAIALAHEGLQRTIPQLGQNQRLDSQPTAHVGFYLIGMARMMLEARLNYRPAPNVRMKRWVLTHPTLAYLGSIGLFTVVVLAALLYYAATASATLAQLAIVAVFSFVPGMAVAISIVNGIVTRAFPPRTLPRMDFSKSIPNQYRAMVVIPALLTRLAEIDELLQELEMHYLRNPEPQLMFALLSDFADAPHEHMSDDETLIAHARKGIETLNQKYSEPMPFFLFHRARKWNPVEGVWMGWERKRGKLSEFNRLLLNSDDTSFSIQVGNQNLLPDIKYVITLDADTILPRGSASRLLATLAHPLNRAQFSADGRSVVAGYTILQPRVEIKPTSANQSLFTRVYAGDVGLDLYTRAVSDVYQDLFGEGIYVGKGIYNVTAFERSLAGRVPENTLLSHDLLEGTLGRTALTTDVILLEDFPAHYLIYSRRLHRWIRGDWQLLPWLFPRVPTTTGTAPNPLSIIDRWKLFDNLRRSLLAPFLLALLTAAWLGVLPGSFVVWTLLVIFTPAVSIATQTVAHALQYFGQQSPAEAIHSAWPEVMRWLLALVFLPYEALLALDAITTTLFRLLISRRHFLQWITAADAARRFATDVRSGITWRAMITSLILTGILGLLSALLNPAALLVAAPALIIWFVAPQVAHEISRPTARRTPALTASQNEQLRHLARRTWAFFEQFVGPDDHWLPPDHFQESPRGIVAHHTSPTNIGLLLLSTLSAYDLGYIGLLGLTLRLRSTFDSMDQLQRYRGHLLNWYDTRTFAPLPPSYVSTVDSGNLAACLLALRQGCLALDDSPVVGTQRWQGLDDILSIVVDILKDMESALPYAAIGSFVTELYDTQRRVQEVRDKPERWAAELSWLASEGWNKLSQHMMGLFESNLPNLDAEVLAGLRLYLERLQRHLDSMQRNIDLLAPWLTSIYEPPNLFITTPLAQDWQAVRALIPAGLPRLREAAPLYDSINAQLAQLQAKVGDHPDPAYQEAQAWCQKLSEGLSSARLRIESLQIGYHDLAARAEAYVEGMDFGFLFDEPRQIFRIGYNVTSDTLDANYYDLLASEARIASLLAIAERSAPANHWLHLARPVTEVNGELALLSWSGTMFEYLMPTLLTPNFEGTFLARSCRVIVDYQISYAQQKHVPWGISESGYYAFDAHMNYQYRAFGVPRLGLKRGLAEDLVISPYASLISLPLRPHEVLANLARFKALHMLSHYGLYEAIDYTPGRVPEGQDYAIVESYMAHHQGMILVALCNQLLDEPMVKRFWADARLQSIDLLLQEKFPVDAPVEHPHQGELADIRPSRPPVSITPWRVQVDAPVPQVHVLSQGRYSVLITSAGSGYSQWGDIALTRWQADSTLDNWGMWIYIQDRDSGALWSTSYQPTAVAPDSREVLFFPHKVEFRRQDGDISSHMEIAVGPDDIEVRRITLLNNGEQPRRLKLTSYGEVVLAPQTADLRHPAFSKLFVESEYLPDLNALVFRRRRRSSKEKPLYAVHMLVLQSGFKVTGEYETDRGTFLGRGRTPRSPAALLDPKQRLSRTVGATLDPIMSLAQEVDLPPHATVQFAYLTLAAQSRQEAVSEAKRYQAWSLIERAFDEARARCEIELTQFGLNTAEVAHIQQILSALIYPTHLLRAKPEVLAANRKGQSGLWGYGISGDYPILLLRITDPNTTLLLEAVQAHAYWRRHHITINVVILNQQGTGYLLGDHNLIYQQIVSAGAESWLNHREGIFLVRADQISEEDRILLETTARVILDGENGSLAEQVNRLTEQPVHLPAFVPSLPDMGDPEPTPPLERPTGLVMDNGLGGFSSDGREYLIYLEPGAWTPHPWINIIANENFGFLMSEAGAGCSWAENSGENRLTSWRNDPVSDTPSEALYLRDEETTQIWSPTPLPVSARAPYLIRHGAGYSVFEHQSHGLKQQLRVFAAPGDPIKIVRLRLENLWTRNRRITVTYYVEWVLGTTRDTMQQFVVPEFEPGSHALLAHNRYNAEFGARVAFLAASKEPHGLTADRAEFLGRMGSLRNPAALRRIGLASRVHAGLDPCAAIQLHVDLKAGDVEEVFFLIGEGADRDNTLALIQRYQDPAQVEAAWHAANAAWDDMLSMVTVRTPDSAMNLLLNRWLLYQTLSCRVWGRSALYQSSGAFGFRDQLQDVMALLHARPDIAREQILRAARHQFEAGDVLHWWHPPSGRGVRTRISDDLLWLPFVTAHYVTVTGDSSILNERVPFLKGEPLKPEEEERYGLYESTTDAYTIYEHCRRAIQKGSTSGPHGLPLIGTGDWNDALNRVGIEGRGESVWLGWFLYATLMRFLPFCAPFDDDPDPYREQAERLRQALETHGADENWYRRAYYDDGWPLGSSLNREGQIDSIAQSWAVLSDAADPVRAAQAMESVNERLIQREDQLILLFTPPFDKTPRDPGYIKGYPPGIRENGGQYTHAATWVAWAFAVLNQGDQAEALFRLLNPIYHADTPEKVKRYHVEPYVIAADIYSVPPHVGQGGWTWYTGSAAWMYRLGLEAILGVQRQGNKLCINPCIPGNWPAFEFTYRADSTEYHVVVDNPDGVSRGVRQITLDSAILTGLELPLAADHQQHEVRVLMGTEGKQAASADSKPAF